MGSSMPSKQIRQAVWQAEVGNRPSDGAAIAWLSALTSLFTGGAKGIRTPDLFHAMEARYQLRHSPVPCGRRSTLSDRPGVVKSKVREKTRRHGG